MIPNETLESEWEYDAIAALNQWDIYPCEL